MKPFTSVIEESSGRALHLCILHKYGSYSNCAREWGVTRQLPHKVCSYAQFTYKVAYKLAKLFNVPPPLFCYEPLVVLAGGKIAAYESFIEQAFKDPEDRAYVKAGKHIKYRDIAALLDKYTKEDPYGRTKKRTAKRKRVSNKRKQQEHGLCELGSRHADAD